MPLKLDPVSAPPSLVVSDILAKARLITGNTVGNSVGDTGVPDEAIQPALDAASRDLSQALSLSVGKKEVVLTLTPNQQDYPLATLAGDIKSVEAVTREAAGRGGESWSDSVPGDLCHVPCIDMGMQQDTLRVIQGVDLASRLDRFDWYVIGGSLRLIPCPTWAEKCAIEYQSSGATVGDLPADAESGLVYAAVVAILNALANRIMSDRLTGKTISDNYGNPIVSQERLNLVTKQRDYYQALLDKECDRLRNL